MNKRAIAGLAASLLLMVTAAWAQTNQPLNLKLPPGGYQGYPAAAATSAQPASSTTSAKSKDAVTVNGHPAATSPAPGVYYGDTSGARGDHQASAVPVCDDSTYNQTQMHGSVGVGVVSGSHIGTGNYQSGNVSMVKNTGSCEHPTGSVGISIGVSRFGGFNGH